MVMQGSFPAKKVITQTAVGTWAASSEVRTDLERHGVVTRVEVTLELTPSATGAGAIQRDGIWKPLQNLQIASGGNTFFQLPSTGEGGNSGVLLSFLNREDFGGASGFAGQIIVAPGRTYHPANFVFHCGSRPMRNGLDNPWDLSGGLPAGAVSNLVATWSTGLNSVMDDTITLSSAVARYKLYYLVGTDAQFRAEMDRQGVQIPVPGATLMVPEWTVNPLALTSTYPDYSLTQNLPVSGYLRRMSVLCQDATGTRPMRAADEITGIKISLGTTDLTKEFTDAMSCKLHPTPFEVADDAVGFGGMHAGVGVFIRDFRQLGHPDYGLNFLNQQVGNPQVGFTVSTNASGDDALILYEKMVPHFGQIGQN